MSADRTQQSSAVLHALARKRPVRRLNGYVLIALATVLLVVIVTALPARQGQQSVELPGAVSGGSR